MKNIIKTFISRFNQKKTETENLGYYGENIWSLVAKRVFPVLDKGCRVYGEIIGWTPNGKSIQKGYCYGLPKGELDFLVYRVDIVNFDGQVFTLSHDQMLEFCQKRGLRNPETLYRGKAKDLFSDIPVDHHWHQNLLERLEREFLGKLELKNADKTLPEEGICVRIVDGFKWKVFKLKDLAFLGHETNQLDKGEVSVEDEEVQEEMDVPNDNENVA